MEESDPMTQPEQSVIDRQITVEYTLERLDDLRLGLGDLIAAVEGSPHEPPRDLSWLPPGALSALEGIGTAIYAAEERWRS